MKIFCPFVVALSLVLVLSNLPEIAEAGATSPFNGNRHGNGTASGSDSASSAGADAGGASADRHPSQTMANSAENSPSSLENARVGDLIHLAGKLKCDLGSANTGEPCMLKFSDSGSGRTFQLTDETKAMKLYFNDTREVQLDGRLMGSETLEVVDVRKQ